MASVVVKAPRFAFEYMDGGAGGEDAGIRRNWAALDAVDEEISDEQRREDLYLSGLAHYVAALGGRIEVRAVFGDEEILIRRSPEEGA